MVEKLIAELAKQPAEPQGEPVAWEKLRKVNMPYPGESGMRVIGFVVPDDGEPMALITERLKRIIGPAPRVAERVAELEADLAALEADLTQAVQMYTDAAGERDKALADLAAAQAYATTLAVSMHKQHYAEAAPNWQPLPDLVGLLTQIDNMYAGLRNDLEAAEVENKRLVGLPLATIKEERERAIAEVECLWVAIQNHCSANTIKAIESELEAK